MSGRLVHIGDKATQEFVDLGDEATPEFDRAAADAARAAGLSEDEIAEMFGYLPPAPMPLEPAESKASGNHQLRS